MGGGAVGSQEGRPSGAKFRRRGPDSCGVGGSGGGDRGFVGRYHLEGGVSGGGNGGVLSCGVAPPLLAFPPRLFHRSLAKKNSRFVVRAQLAKQLILYQAGWWLNFPGDPSVALKRVQG